jgi:GTP-binding protein HflX
VIPELPMVRGGKKRLSGRRLIHTHVKRGEGLTTDDINDLLLLRLDSMTVVEILTSGAPGKITLAVISPESKDRYESHQSANLAEINNTYAGLIEQAESDLETAATPYMVKKGQTAMLIHVSEKTEAEMDSSLNELEELALTADITVVDRVTQLRAVPDPKYLIGRGKLKDFMVAALSHGIDIVIFDTELTASQLKAVTDFTDIEVMDRTQLILSIFEKRAKSSDGKVRVSLAKMRYLLPRLGAKESALSRIRGGIGLRGPGETTAEVQRRYLKGRIARLEKELEELKSKRETRRRARLQSEAKIISVIGYTNAGKSTLVNRLTGSSLYVEDRLFATLDPSARRLRLPHGLPTVISDTVGLIRDMPESIVGVFRATLEELSESDLILNVVDISDPGFEEHMETTNEIMSDVGLAEIPSVTVFNKTDSCGLEQPEGVALRFGAISVSAKNGSGIKTLLGEIESALTG